MLLKSPFRRLTAFALVWALWIASGAPAAIAADDDTFVDAPVLHASGTQPGTLTYGTDFHDRYQVILTEDMWAQFTLTGPAGTDFDLELYSTDVVLSETATPTAPPEDHYLVAASATPSTSGESIGVLIPPGGGGTYYIEVSTFQGSGAYTLTFSHYFPKAPRLSGADRYRTSYAISRSSFTTADTVVVASGAGFPDALAAASLAGAVDGPVLLAPPATNSGDTRLVAFQRELTRLRAKTVLVVGGSSAVNDFVFGQIENNSQFVTSAKRIGGRDRYETARLVAEETRQRTGNVTQAFVVRGDDFADALAVAPYAYHRSIPVLLTRTSSLHAQAATFIEARDVTDVVIAGGTAAVGPSVESSLRTLNGGATQVDRKAGSDRYATAVEVARYSVDERGWGSWERFGIATGVNFPDALSGGAACGMRGGGALLLTRPAALSTPVSGLLGQKASPGTQALVFGGTAVLSEEVRTQVEALIP